MANIKVVVQKPIADGYKLKFRTPCDSTTIEGLEVKYPAKNGVGTLIKNFVFKDAHGMELSGVGNLFVSGVMLEVLLDVTHGVAYIKNADTNSYVESIRKEISAVEKNTKEMLAFAEKAIANCEDAASNANQAADIAKGAAGGVVTIEQNNNAPLKFWVGTQEEYEALSEEEKVNCFCIIPDDSEYKAIMEKIETEVGKKLSKTHINEGATVSTADEAKEKYMAWFKALGNGEAGRYVMSVNGSVRFVDIYRVNENYGVIMTTQYSSGGANISYASVIDGVLGDLVRSEPQMELGVEYCTMERFLGGIVYAKLISVSESKAEQNKDTGIYTLSVNHGIANLSSIKSVSAICKNYDNTTFTDMASLGGYGLTVDSQNVVMVYDTAISSGKNSTVFVELKYTKKSS